MKYHSSVASLVLTVVAVILLSCGHLAPSFSAIPGPHQVNKIEQNHAQSSYLNACNSVVFIHSSFTYIHDGVEYKVGGWGTGFVVGPRLIATNKHVALPHKFDYWYNFRQANPKGLTTKAAIKRYVWLPGTRHTLLIGLPDYESAISDTVVIKQAADVQKVCPTDCRYKPFSIHDIGANDCALLQTKEKINATPLKIGSIEDYHKGKKVYIIGYPGGKRCFDTPFVNPSVSVGWVKKVEEQIRLFSSVLNGNSGGPVVLEDGTVVGMLSSVSRDTATLSYAIRSRDFKTMLGL